MLNILNNVVLIGRLTRDPELRYSQGETAICSFTLAVDRPRQKDKENEADFIPIVCFKATAEASANHLKKGHRTAIEGRIQTRNYENNEGRKIYVTEVIANNVRFLESQNSGSNGGSNTNTQTRSESGSGGQSGSMRDPFQDDGKPIDISDDDLPF